MTENATHASRNAGAVTPKTASFGVRHRRGFITAAVVGVLLALVGALETSQIHILPRLAYWEILMLSGAMIGLGVSEGVERWGRLRKWPWVEMPFIATLIALPLTMMVVGTSAVFFNLKPPSLAGLAIMFGITFAVSLAMTALNYLMHWPGTGLPDPVTEPAKQAEPEAVAVQDRFTQRLPLHLQSSAILALQSEDHYLRVHTEAGEALILMRLSDAIAELSTLEGAQTHRGWWVAKAAITKAKRTDGKGALTLKSGVEAPVSRSYLKDIAALGWFA
jgi:DNA-binding LytR/AlgR family response regulator